MGEFTTPVLGGNFETELVEDFFQALAVSGAHELTCAQRIWSQYASYY